MRDIIGAILMFIIVGAVVIGFISVLALGIAVLTGLPFWFGFFIGSFLIFAYTTTLGDGI
ncbi:hypothetical protein [Paenibacillus sp. SI8]|uniref:hypothetical protein n=1 Tax=unclassified Paenibacillus TaxID=185978 RepID=UPI0034655A86